MNDLIGHLWTLREAVPRAALCAWGDCHKTATTRVGEWESCDGHRDDLRVYDVDQPDTDPESIKAAVLRLHAQGLSERAIATRLGVHNSTVRWHRKAAGLPLNPPPGPQGLKPCGTAAAAARHRRKGEPLDDACHKAERAYKVPKLQAWRRRTA